MEQSQVIYTAGGNPVNFIPSIAVAVTPHDTDTFQGGLLFVGVGGDVKAMPKGLSTFVTFKGVAAGAFLPIYVKAVHTDTTATDLLVCY